jgi:hypothetical protein
MTPAITPYYLDRLDQMAERIKASRPGKRFWTVDEVTGYHDCRATVRSTFPEWSRVVWCKGELVADRRECLAILDKARTGVLPRSANRRRAFGDMVDGYRDEEYDEEMKWKEMF